LHNVLLHPAAGLLDATCDFPHGPDDFRMVRLARIAETLREIVWTDTVQIDARYREDSVKIVQHGRILQKRADYHLLVRLTVVRRLIGDPGIVVGAAVRPERPLAERAEVARPRELARVRLRGDVRTQYPMMPRSR
jgi:hypothetical protein